MPAPAPPDAEDFDRHVRRVAPERWLASRLIADAAARTEVLALYALDDELAKVAPAVSQPVLGALRLQWWSEALERTARGGAADHPVLQALAPALTAGRLNRDWLEMLIASYEAELEPQPLADEPSLVAWLDARFGTVMGLAARLLDPAAAETVVVNAGRAWGWSAQLRAAPAWRARGRDPWPADWPADWDEAGVEPRSRVQARIGAVLTAARTELKALPTAAFPAVAYATLARGPAGGRTRSQLAAGLKLLWASVRGAV